MIYLIEGEEELFIRNKINEIKACSNCEIIKFDGNDKSFGVDALVNACNSNSLFSEKTLILVKDPDFLIKKIDENKLDSLISYIENPLYETDLVFYTYENKFNGKLKMYKQIVKNAQVFSFKQMDYKNFNNYAISEIRNASIKIDKEAAFQLIGICKRNATLLNQNLNILKNYPDKIDINVVNRLCSMSEESDTFDLINALTSKDISKAIYLERKMLNDSNSIAAVIGLLASQLRFLYQIAYYLSIGKNKKEILEITQCNEYRYTKSLESLNILTLDKIIGLLNNLSKLDIECKVDSSTSDIDKFELFILEMMKKDNHDNK